MQDRRSGRLSGGLSTYYLVLERIANRLNQDRPFRFDPDEEGRRIQELQLALEEAGGIDES